MITFGSVSSIMGIFIYFLLPLALIKKNISILFTVFLALLLGLLFGMIILAFNLQILV